MFNVNSSFGPFSVSGRIDVSGDRDVFKIGAPEGAEYLITVTTSGLQFTEFLSVEPLNMSDPRNSVEGLFQTLQYPVALNSSGQQTTSFFAEAGETYFASVSTALTSLPSSDAYALELISFTDDAAAHQTTTASFNVGGTFSGTQDFSGDRDWVRLNVTAGSNYLLSSDLSNSDVLFVVAFDESTGLRVDLPLLAATNSFAAQPQVGFNARDGVEYFAIVADTNGSLDSYNLTLSNLVADAANDTTTALSVAPGESVQSTLAVHGDYDWIRLETVAGESYRVDLSFPTGFFGSNGFSILEVDNTTGEVLSVREGYSSFAHFSAKLGSEYFLEVVPGFSAAANGTYQVDLSTFVDDFPDNETTSGVLAPGQTINLTRDSTLDIDFVMLDVTAGLSYQVSGTTLFDIVRSDLLAFDSEAASGFGFDFHDPRVDFGAPSFDGLGITGNISPEPGFEYFLVTDASSFTRQYTLTEIAPEVPDSVSTTVTLSPDETFSGTLETRTDQDWIRLNLEDGESYQLNVTGFVISLVVFSESASGTIAEVGSRISETGNFASQTVVTGRAGETLYAQIGAIESLGPGSAGSPAYSVSLTPIVDDFSDSFTNAPVLGDDSSPTIVGTAENDTLVGGGAAETLSGLDGDDTIEGGGGGDTIDGGEGNDTASYETSTGGVTVALDGLNSGGDAAGDTLISIENVTGSSEADSLTGDDASNILRGRRGNDVLNGGAGSDTMDGGLGNDRFFVDDAGDVVIEGVGEGTDLVSTSVDFTLPDNVENGSTLGTGNVAVTGNALANFITGNSGANTLRGEGGADRLIAFDGDDVLEGGADNDILEGGLGADRFVVTAANGNDQIIGWEVATDVLDFEALGLRFVDLAITSSGNEALITFDDPAGGSGSIRLAGIDPEALEIGLMSDLGGVGSPGGVPLTAGTSGADNLAATNGDDDVVGLAGNDILNGRAGADTMVGGFGNDRYFLDDAGDLAIEQQFQGTDQMDATFSFTLAEHIENGAVLGGGAVDITGNGLANFITGSALSNVLTGLDGRDRLIGFDGDDTLIGGLENDVLEGGAGADVFVFAPEDGLNLITDFEVGVDLIDVTALNVSFADLTIVDGLLGARVIFDLTPGSVDLVTVQGVAAADLRLTSFLGAPNDPIVGTEGNDVLFGTIENDELQGLGGADLVDGRAGADTMLGGLGDDRYFVDDAGDVVTELPGEGTDLVSSFIDFTLPDNVENGSALGAGDVDLTGNGLANALTGNAGANTLSGEDGPDNLQGLAGADLIDGGAGTDVLRGGADADTFLFETGNGTDQIIDFEIDVDTINLSATGLAFGDLTIVDTGANATITYGTDTITVFNVSAAQLDQDQFDFA